LRLDGVDDFGDGDVELGELIGLHPEAHGVLTPAKHLDAGNAGDPRHLVVDVDVGIIGEKDVVIGDVGRKEREHDEGRGGGLLHRHAEAPHVGGQLGFGLALAHLGQDLIGVGVRFHVEIDIERHLTVVGVDGIHVVHVVNARHLLLNGRCHGLFDGHRVSPRVRGFHLDFGGNDIGELSDGQPGHGHEANDHHEDRDHHGHNGTIDEESGHGRLLFPGGWSGGRFRCR